MPVKRRPESKKDMRLYHFNLLLPEDQNICLATKLKYQNWSPDEDDDDDDDDNDYDAAE